MGEFQQSWGRRAVAVVASWCDRLVMGLLRPGLRYIRHRMATTLSERSRLRLNDFCHDMQINSSQTSASQPKPIKHSDVNTLIQAAEACANDKPDNHPH